MSSFLKPVLAAGLLSMATLPALAEDAAPEWFKTLKVDGFVDAYYKFNPDGIHAAGPTVSVFDDRQNMFTVAGGRLGLKSGDPAKGPYGAVDLYYGDYAKVLSGNTALPANQEEIHIGQAFISDVFGPLTFTLGHFMTHVGYEVADAPNNWNYSRSLLYSQVPFDHVGLKVNYAVTDTLGLMAQLDNGNGVLTASNESTAGGAQISYSGIKGLSLYGNYYLEPNLDSSMVFNNIHYFDLVASYSLMDGLDLAGEYLYKTLIASSQTNTAGDVITTYSQLDPSTGKLVAFSPKMQGYALYANYKIPMMESLIVTPRFEAWYKPDDAGADYADFDYTLTLKYLKGNLKHWLELRSDASSQAKFVAVPSDPTNMRYYELTVTYAATYSF